MRGDAPPPRSPSVCPLALHRSSVGDIDTANTIMSEKGQKQKETHVKGSSESCHHCKPKTCANMAVPPAYADLGKSAKDIFSKGYGFGAVKLDLKTKSQSGVEFSTGGSSNTDTGKAAGQHLLMRCDLQTVFSPFEVNCVVLYVCCSNDGTEFGGSIYQKVNGQLETAVNLAWTAGSNNTRFGIAVKYQLDKDSSISAKVNNASLVGVGYTQSLRPGVKLTLSALIDTKNFNAGGHKVGMCFELEV
ncbi:voltage-dependent anion-selective channel protein 2-like [Sinocyclocheilus anshuiensis]|uniref:voltage-dependent anion-selective channel protein 2-like n=1 Tax=Sinocyclocheilus anshuiensis TaxID=1608454 RepID=UPI0007B8B5A7|nr:PREDICTED: voltage-dependent anion-selective channel protein 2-like [Sinocyclocheilus anshuiensis]